MPGTVRLGEGAGGTDTRIALARDLDTHGRSRCSVLVDLEVELEESEPGR
jgi:hypothetical protein